MGHSQASKAETHERIVRIAAERLREQGINGVSVADLMKEAGLTVGGFYKHFGSRDELVGEALQTAMRQSGEGVTARLAAVDEAAGETAFARYVDDYLSEAHRDGCGTGCVLGTLVEDAQRGGERTRALFTEHAQGSFGRVATLLRPPTGGGDEEGDEETRRRNAIVVQSALIGAIGLARLMADKDQSREVLSAVAGFLKDAFGPDGP